MNIDQVKPGPPDNRTTYSLPSLRIPEEEESEARMPEHKEPQQIIDQQIDNKEQIQLVQPPIEKSIIKSIPVPHKYYLRSQPQQVIALTSNEVRNGTNNTLNECQYTTSLPNLCL
ncbi:MAG: hypothetical protein GY861_10450 [bacterium]|nr:hypothetical protein [bacterium]